ncbi:MAG: hypothetical protein ACRDHZ_06010 [Ktedonobacteraceae bacterium]
MHIDYDAQLVYLDPLYDSETGEVLADMELFTYSEALCIGIIRMTDTVPIFTSYE